MIFISHLRDFRFVDCISNHSPACADKNHPLGNSKEKDNIDYLSEVGQRTSI